MIKLLHRLFGRTHFPARVPEFMSNDLVLDKRSDKVAWVAGFYWQGDRRQFVEVVYVNGSGRIDTVRRDWLTKIS